MSSAISGVTCILNICIPRTFDAPDLTSNTVLHFEGNHKEDI